MSKNKATKTKSVERIFTPPPTHWVGNGFRVHGFFPNQTLGENRMSTLETKFSGIEHCRY
jgi:hypothetical protein